jgi:5-methylcytosine-specific restriction enzyme A
MGDETKFWQGPFQSLCGPCHNSTKQALEKSGTPKITVRIGLDGWPQ